MKINFTKAGMKEVNGKNIFDIEGVDDNGKKWSKGIFSSKYNDVIISKVEAALTGVAEGTLIDVIMTKNDKNPNKVYYNITDVKVLGGGSNTGSANKGASAPTTNTNNFKPKANFNSSGQFRSPAQVNRSEVLKAAIELSSNMGTKKADMLETTMKLAFRLDKWIMEGDKAWFTSLDEDKAASMTSKNTTQTEEDDNQLPF